MSRSNVVSLADARARREGWQKTKVETTAFQLPDGRYELRLADEEETYAVQGDRAWMEALHAKLGRVLGK